MHTGGMSEQPVASVSVEVPPSWADVVNHVERGKNVAVIAHGQRVADVVPPGELDRLRATIDVLSDSELVRDLVEELTDARHGRVATSDTRQVFEECDTGAAGEGSQP